MIRSLRPPTIPLLAALAAFSCGTVRAQHAPVPTTPPGPNAPAPGSQPAGPPSSTSDDAETPPAPANFAVNPEMTVINQTRAPFASPYEGAFSFRPTLAARATHTYTLYMGGRVGSRLQAYLNPEMVRGSALSQGQGIAGYVNGDLMGQPYLSDAPYFARYFLRYNLPTGRGTEVVQAGQNQLAGSQPSKRLTLWLGKISIPDLFDSNSFANNARSQFMNLALMNNGAYDYAEDTRGYTRGVAAEWIRPNWAVRAGSFQMPVFPGAPVLSTDLLSNRGDQVELELHPKLLRGAPSPAVIRFLGWHNVGDMGNYQEALRLPRHGEETPEVSLTRRTRDKFGAGLNFEQALNADGSTGLFGRLGWNTGVIETACYMEADQSLSLGGQLSGARWGRPNDWIALAVAQNDLTLPHLRYLAAGGLGFNLGDGALDYGPEQILETYYNWQVSNPLALSLDYQFVRNPGYNHARGPVHVFSVRFHVAY